MLRYITRKAFLTIKLTLLLIFHSIVFAKTKVLFALPSVPGDPFWDVVVRGAKDAAVIHDVDLEIMNYIPDNIDDELHILDLALSKPSNATMVVLYYQSPKLLKSLQKYTSSDHILQIVNSGESALAKVNITGNYIGSNDYQAGFVMGQGLAKVHVSNIMFITHLSPNNAVVAQRVAGLQAALSNAKITVLDVSDKEDPVSAMRESVAKSHSDTIAVLGPKSFNDYVKAVNLKKGATPIKNFVSFDLTKPIADSIRSGHTLFTIDQQPYLQGYYAVANSDLYKKYKVHPVGSIMTGPQRIYASQIDDIYDDLGITR